MNAASSQPDLLAIVGANTDLTPAVAALGYRRLHTPTPGAALWTRSDERRIATQSDDDRSTAFFGVTTTPGPIGMLGALRGELSAEFSADPFTLVGHFTVMRVTEGSLSIVTDHMGAVPVFVASSTTGAGARVAGTNLNDVARLAGRTAIDPVSAFEFAHVGLITAPHTIFSGVSRIGAGTVSDLTLDDESAPVTETRYWVPAEGESTAALDVAAQQLASLMQENLRGISAQFRRLVILMSGGEDSRILARACKELRPDADGLSAVIFTDGPNREWRLARAAARVIGIDLSGRVRSSDHYTKSIPQTVSLVGGGIDLTHAHSIGLIDAGEADLFLDGWSADSIYKAHTFKTKSRKIGGIQVGLEHPDISPSSLGPNEWTSHEVGAQVLARRDRKRSQLLEFRTPAEASAWMSLWPISDHPDFALFASNWRSRPSLSPFMLGNMVTIAAAVPVEQKVNRRLFHHAFSSSLGAAGWIPRTAGQIPRLGARSNLVAANAMKVVFRAVAQVERWRGVTVAQGPWQSFETRRAAVREAMAAAPPALLLEADRLACGIDGAEAGESSLSDATSRWSTDQSNRVLQLVALLDQVRARDA